MPDGDIIHKSLPRLYQRPYRFLCEGKAEDDECSKALQRALKHDLQKAGDVLAQAALVVGDAIDRVCSQPGDFDAAAANVAVDEALRAIGCPSAHREGLRDAARDVAQGLRYGDAGGARDSGEEVYRRFAIRRAESQFEARVPLTDAHHNGANPVEIEGRVRAMAPDIERAASAFARKVASGGSVSEFRLPPKRRRPVSLEENLL